MADDRMRGGADERDAVFEEEQAHLSATYAKLLDMRGGIERKLARAAADAARDKASMVDDLSLNLASIDDALEMCAAYATVNSVVDSYNIAQDIGTRKLRDLESLLRQPYFAKIVLRYEDGKPPRELYLGVAGMTDEMCRILVVDWRSPVAEVYYNQESGRTSYRANGRTISVDLELRRQFDIEADRLRAYFDTTVAIQDELLLASLSQRRGAHMRAITATIQKEQNTVVRHEDVPALIVSGVAGSGKTSVLLQRIAYLFYRERENLDPSQVVLMTPNPVFARYIADVLPDLGEDNPETTTWDAFAAALAPAGRARGDLGMSLDDLDRIEDAVPHVQLAAKDFRAIEVDGTRFVDVNQICRLMAKFKHVPMGPRRITLVREELAQKVQTRFKNMAHREAVQDEMAALPPDEQLRIFHETIAPQTDQDIYMYTLQYVRDRYAQAVHLVESDAWLKVDRIGMRMLDAPGLSPVAWLYVKMALTGLANADVRYVMVDEVQDYTAAQLAVLAKYYRRAHFMLLGDENQAIEAGRASFNEVRRVFERARSAVDTCSLMTSYRSTAEVTRLFGSLAETRGMHIASVRAGGRAPRIEVCEGDAAWERALVRAVAEAQAAGGLAAVIVPWKAKFKELAAALGDAMPPVLEDTGELPTQGVVALTLKLAKGLEFDRVVVPDASGRAFPEDDLARRRLYTTVSRATQDVTLVSRGPLTPLLDAYTGCMR